MTIQGQIDQLKKELSGITEQLGAEIEELKQKIKQDHIADTSKKVKPTRHYPNGAYMDEPAEREAYWFITADCQGVHSAYWENEHNHLSGLYNKNCFPIKKAAEKELNRQKLTAKMYRDMRDERINGEWVADWSSNDFETQDKNFPILDMLDPDIRLSTHDYRIKPAHDFIYKNQTYVEDLKALGWTEEELKIVWFRV